MAGTLITKAQVTQ